ncbi:MAG: hypothetical protein FWD29_05760 [Micrococcales bacterium]|nr:hypothetical protein [Micrococcales bacterium]
MTTPDQPQYSQQPPQPAAYGYQPPAQAPQPYGVAPAHRPASGGGFSMSGGLWSTIGLGAGGLFFVIGLILVMATDSYRPSTLGNHFFSAGLTILGLVILGEIIASAIKSKK